MRCRGPRRARQGHVVTKIRPRCDVIDRREKYKSTALPSEILMSVASIFRGRFHPFSIIMPLTRGYSRICHCTFIVHKISRVQSMSAAAQYDALVVGGGHHGTIIACYLARAGLKVGVFERKPHFGGGATSGRGPAPGFLMNYCSPGRASTAIPRIVISICRRKACVMFSLTKTKAWSSRMELLLSAILPSRWSSTLPAARNIHSRMSIAPIGKCSAHNRSWRGRRWRAR